MKKKRVGRAGEKYEGKGVDPKTASWYSSDFARPNRYSEVSWVRGGRNINKLNYIRFLDEKKAWDALEKSLKDKVPENVLETLRRTFPEMLKAGFIFKKIVTEHKKRYRARDEIEAFKQLAQHPAPEAVVLDYLTPEDLKTLHKLHVKLYHVLPGFFEKKSGVEHLLRMKGVPEDEIRKIEEEALAELQGRQTGVGHTGTGKTVGEYKGIPLEEGDRVEKYPGTNIEIIRKADGRIIVLPHKSVKEIPYLAGPDRQKWLPETVARMAANTIRKADFDRIREEIDKSVEMLNQIVALAKSGKNVKDLAEDVEKMRKNHGEFAKVYGWEIADWLRKHDTLYHVEGYTSDHAAAEYSTGIVTLLEIKKLLRDIEKHPEKYGIDINKLNQRDIKEWKKLENILKENVKHVQGFYHKRKR